MNHIVPIDEIWGQAIFNGTKTLEGKKMSAKWIGIKPGDTITFTNPRFSFSTLVTKINYYPPNSSLNDPLTQFLIMEGINNALPGITTLTEARNIYLGYFNSSNLDEAQKEVNGIGMMAIHLQKL